VPEMVISLLEVTPDNVLLVLITGVSMLTLVTNHVQLICTWKITCVKLVTLPVLNVTDQESTNVMLAQKVNISMMPMLVFHPVQMVNGKMKKPTNVTHVTILVPLVSDQMITNVIPVMPKPILKKTTVNQLVYFQDIMKILLIGLVNHVMLPVVNVTDLLTDNVILVVTILLQPT